MNNIRRNLYQPKNADDITSCHIHSENFIDIIIVIFHDVPVEKNIHGQIYEDLEEIPECIVTKEDVHHSRYNQSDKHV